MKTSAALARVLLVLAIAGGSGTTALALEASPAPTAVPSASASDSASPAPLAAPSDAVSTEDPAMTALATSLVAQAQSGKIDRSLFEAKTSAALTQALVDNVAQRMAPLGKPKSVTFERHATVGVYNSYHYRIAWNAVAVDESFALDAAGKIVGWYFQPTT